MTVYLRDDIQQIEQSELDELLPLLPSWRRERALCFKHLAGQVECVTSFLLLAEALQREYGITDIPPFALTPQGKPFLADYPHIHFNLSHCRKAVLCAVSDNPVGVDIEAVRTARPELVRYTMNAQEQALIQSSPNPDLAFTTLWTRKEALLKLTGEGVGSHMHDILLPERLNDAHIHIDTTVCRDYVYSVALNVEG